MLKAGRRFRVLRSGVRSLDRLDLATSQTERVAARHRRRRPVDLVVKLERLDRGRVCWVPPLCLHILYLLCPSVLYGLRGFRLGRGGFAQWWLVAGASRAFRFARQAAIQTRGYHYQSPPRRNYASYRVNIEVAVCLDRVGVESLQSSGARVGPGLHTLGFGL